MLVMEVAASDPTTPLTAARKGLIEQRFREFFPDNRGTPDHPTYAVMILRAISELNEEGGSCEEAISSFIKTEYEDLPWAHSTILKHHLGKLCDSREIVITREMRYVPCEGTIRQSAGYPLSPNTKRGRLKVRQRKRCGGRRGRPRKKDMVHQAKECETDLQMINEEGRVIVAQNEAIEVPYLLNEEWSDNYEIQDGEQKNNATTNQNRLQEQQNEVNRSQEKSLPWSGVITEEVQRQEHEVAEEQLQLVEKQTEASGHNQVEQQYHEARREIFKFCKSCENGANNELEEPAGQRADKGMEKFSKAQQQLNLADAENSPACFAVAGLSSPQYHQQQEGEKTERRPLIVRFRLPKHESAMIVAGTAPLQQPDFSVHGSPHEPKLDMATTNGEASNLQQEEHDQCQLVQKRGRGGCRTVIPNEGTTTMLPLHSNGESPTFPQEDHDQCPLEQKCGQGRRRKLIQTDGTITMSPIHSNWESPTLQQEHDQCQLVQKRGRGRHSKVTPNEGTTTTPPLHSQPKQPELSTPRRRGRPPKCKLLAAEKMVNSKFKPEGIITALSMDSTYDLSPSSQQEQPEQPMPRRRGRPPK